MDMTITGNQVVDAIIGLLILISGGGMTLKRLGFISFGKQAKENCMVKKKDCKKDREAIGEKLKKGEDHFKEVDSHLLGLTSSVSRIEGGIEMLVKLKGMEMPK